MKLKTMTAQAFSLIAVSMLIFVLVLGTQGRSGDDDQDIMSITISGACLNEEITIKITGKRDKPLDGVDIDIYNRKDRKVAYGKTEDGGIFKFTLDREGTYKMNAENSGYENEEREINVSMCATTTTTILTTTTTTLFSTTTTLETSLTTTTTRSRITTTTLRSVCNKNTICEPPFGENYKNCPKDCPSGYKDKYCDKVRDEICDPDCDRKYDYDCFCNNDGVCENVFERYDNCPGDCDSGVRDGTCDGLDDDICDPDCTSETDPDCKEVDYMVYAYPIIVALLVFGVLAGYAMRREAGRRKHEKNTDDLVDHLKERLRDGEDPKVLREELIAGGQDPELLEKAEHNIWN